MKSRFWALIKFIIGWPFSFLTIFFIVKLFAPKLSLIESKLDSINFLFLFYGIFFFLSYFFFRSFLWQKILQYKGHSLSFARVSLLWAYSELKRYVPGFIWSFVGRAVAFEKEGVNQKITVFSLVIEGQLMILASLFLSLMALPYIFIHFIPNADFKLIPISFLVTGITCAIFIYQTVFFSGKKYEGLRKHFHSFFISHFAPVENLYLLIIALAAFASFGVGAYFTVLSVIPLNPLLFLPLVGLFTFSFLAGYLSFIFPTGLGVREGIVTIGLSKISILPLAGFASIVFRIVLLISEFIYLFILFLVNFLNKEFQPIISWIFKYKYALVLGVFIASSIIYFSSITTLRYQNFYAGRFDLGNADQIVWNTSRGRIFQLTDPDGTAIVSRLSIHADFFLIALAPLYKIWADPRVLLIVQTIVLSFGSIFVYLLGKRLLKSDKIALALGIAYLVNPSVNQSNLYDFHAVVLATTFLLAAFYFAIRQKFILFLIFLILAGSTKEEIWIIAALLCFFYTFKSGISFRNKFPLKKLLPAVLGLVFLSFFFFLVWYAIPAARSSQHFALKYYSDFGDSPTSIVRNMLFSPIKTLTAIITPSKLFYLQQLLLPVGFLSLLAPQYLIFAAPDLLINLLSNNSQLHQIYYQYTAAITPFVLISSLYGLAFIQKKWKLTELKLVTIVLLFAAIGSYKSGPLPTSQYPNIDMLIKPQPNKEVIDNFLNKIPKRYSIAATNNLGSHLSRRRRIYTIPVGMNDADIIAFLLNDQFAQPSLRAQKDMAAKLEHDQGYVEIYKLGDFIAFEKKDLYLHQPHKFW